MGQIGVHLYQIRFQTVSIAVFWVAMPNRQVDKDPQDERRDGALTVFDRCVLALAWIF